MSKHETWRKRQYWQTVGGLLIEEDVWVMGVDTMGANEVFHIIER
jgi:hypothetical protein